VRKCHGICSDQEERGALPPSHLLERAGDAPAALQFNEFINRQDIEGLFSLMTDDHTFVDREGRVDKDIGGDKYAQQKV
jgi:hypothetical protein